MLMKRDETMQNMNYYYDFSGQKFEYPLSLSINQFDRQVFSRQSSLEISYVLKGSYEVITEKMSTVIYEHELAIIAPNDIHMLKMNEKESIIYRQRRNVGYRTAHRLSARLIGEVGVLSESIPQLRLYS